MSKPIVKPWKTPGKNCHACEHSYMEPDSDLICGLPGLNGGLGFTIRQEFGEHCDGGTKFKQHPLRNPDGTLKG